jgi:hypothetical protein
VNGACVCTARRLVSLLVHPDLAVTALQRFHLALLGVVRALRRLSRRQLLHPRPETNGGTLDSPTSAYHLYAAGNWYDSDKDGKLGGRLLGQGDFGTVTWEASPSAGFPTVTQMAANAAYEHVVAKAGASLWRDEVDDYVVAELRSLGRSGATISDESSLGLSGNVGKIPGGTAPKDTDQDGMPDSWEQASQLDSADPADRNGDRNGDGWTNLEEYINSLVP